MALPGFFTSQTLLGMVGGMGILERRDRNLQGAHISQSAQEQSSLLLGDCLDMLQQLDDVSVDCIITDPPYGVNYKSLSRALPQTTIANDGAEAHELLDKALALAAPKLKINSHIYVFTDWHVFAPVVEVVRKHFNVKNVLVWVKNGQTRGDLKGNYGYQHEIVTYAHKGRRYLNGKRDGNVLSFNKVYSNRMVHPTEKPVSLLKYLIEKSTHAGEKVLDMFAGSGSTLLAAKNLGRKYAGIELEEVWYNIARKRLDMEEMKQQYSTVSCNTL